METGRVETDPLCVALKGSMVMKTASVHSCERSLVLVWPVMPIDLSSVNLLDRAYCLVLLISPHCFHFCQFRSYYLYMKIELCSSTSPPLTGRSSTVKGSEETEN